MIAPSVQQPQARMAPAGVVAGTPPAAMRGLALQKAVTRPGRSSTSTSRIVPAAACGVLCLTFQAGRRSKRQGSHAWNKCIVARAASAAKPADVSNAVSIVRRAADGPRSGISGKRVEAALLAMEASPPPGDIPAVNVEGLHSLVYSSAIVDVPFVAGYMPTKEDLLFDFREKRMQLSISTLPFLPEFDVIGENCSYDEEEKVIRYTLRGKDKVSEWQVLYADGEVLAARSNVTGLNICRRIKQ
mmetsp:Transcript_43163/g.101449  ORF Transcript_43163/g.101449 Transcript_43163/m.101449 type:complete len:244 (+) Transcript_43163:101-832(+)